ncbi:hypothetical protein JXA02_07365 [candidate division KSB1 bacterium]|nr:hypothetical protein [candidate division KSB1 bacterium]RQW06517.1 MAG: hypothetical protein EH222_08570 [candidate division KSB1 bacterium]
MTEPIYVGQSPVRTEKRKVTGEYVELNGERFYRITDYDQMAPFFMSIVSDSDHWMFISSNGALTAGRINPDNALFPYYTDDRIHDSRDQTGSKTILLVAKEDKRYLWEPFSPRFSGLYAVRRAIYKNSTGNKILFEEINVDLGLTFRYAWLNSERFGFIKHATLINNGPPARISLLDGIQNILPFGIDRRFQLEYSTLADAYKKSELLADAGLAIFRLCSVPTDKAEPSEALKVTTVWSTGATDAVRLLSARQLDNFRQVVPVQAEFDVKGMRGAYFLQFELALAGGKEKEWFIVADINKDSAAVAELHEFIKTTTDAREKIVQDVEAGTQRLIAIVAQADGLQLTGDEIACKRHFSNVLFNVMRGGIFHAGYWAARTDVVSFIRNANRPVGTMHASFLQELPERVHYQQLLADGAAQNDPTLEKLCHEYMPLTFGRRHGDPSRPWNVFAIEIKNEQGEEILNYQGNWRDIFQNWEALAPAFPDYIESMIAKFVNASTADGYNPYRVTRDGFEWEELDPHDPWSHIGYWGDHQIIYLLKLLELSARYHPGKLDALLTKNIYAYADVPYRIKPYDELLQDPHNTINFDAELDRAIKRRTLEIGSDGKFVRDENGIYHATLAEKLLVTLLAKLTNFIPEAGIWMNTQRPEWNDANNALVGYGVSMVTLCYLRRFLVFCIDLFGRSEWRSFRLSAEVGSLLRDMHRTFAEHLDLLAGALSARERKTILDALGSAGSAYRGAVYQGFAGERAEISAEAIVDFCELTLQYVDHSIRANRRPDGLYHSYNLISMKSGDEIAIRHLDEMLEGQVAVLSSGILTAADAVAVLDALRASALYRADQNSYILYPNRTLPAFMEKNNIPAAVADTSELIRTMLADGYTKIVKRGQGTVHFNSACRNVRLLRQALDELEGTPYAVLARQEREKILDIYEMVFDHQSFTGRSGSFFKYEGLGSIYWHMVAKLQLAVAEIHAASVDEDDDVRAGLVQHYYDIQAGIGAHKSPALYGAFPTDPYSHTPEFAGAQQPGMTGQVKEDILSRFLELGVRVSDGAIHFCADLLKSSEFITAPQPFYFHDVFGARKEMMIGEGCLTFTICQVPVVYHRADSPRIELTFREGETEHSDELQLNRETSAAIFNRTGAIRQVDVYLRPAL